MPTSAGKEHAGVLKSNAHCGSRSFWCFFFRPLCLQVEPLCMGRPPYRLTQCAPRTRAGMSAGSWCWSNSTTPSTMAAGCTSQSMVSHLPTVPGNVCVCGCEWGKKIENLRDILKLLMLKLCFLKDIWIPDPLKVKSASTGTSGRSTHLMVVMSSCQCGVIH